YRRIAFGAAHAVVVPSKTLETIARETWKVPAAKLHRIVNGIPVERYQQRPSAKAIPGLRRKASEVVVGTIAGLRPVK
ncbi:hypothetical protein ABTE36_23675, partial [Acinetobacter baumannii]